MTILGNVPWSFGRKRYPDLATFVAAVEAYNQRIFQRPAPWEPDQRVLPQTSVRIHYEAVRGEYYDDAEADITTPDPEGFTAGELLWRTHEALAQEELADHCFFEGFSVRAPGQVRVHQGS